MNIQDIFKLLICVGNDIENGITPSEHIIDSLKPFAQINMVKESYLAYARGLTDLKLIALLKGLTYVERKLGWAGGSVATCKYLFGVILSRGLDSEKHNEITNWVLCNSSNTFWSPQGSDFFLHYATPSYAESTRIETETKIEEREIQKKKHAHIHQCRKEPGRLELIQKLNNMPVTEQLEMISCDDVYPPNFYPTRCAKLANIRVIESLSPETRHALILRMKGKFKGPWGKFKKRLASVYGEAESHNLWDG